MPGPFLPLPLSLVLCPSLSLFVSELGYNLLIPLIRIPHTNYKMLASAILVSCYISITLKQCVALNLYKEQISGLPYLSTVRWEGRAEKAKAVLSSHMTGKWPGLSMFQFSYGSAWPPGPQLSQQTMIFFISHGQ